MVFVYDFTFETECTQTSKAQTGTVSKSDKAVVKSKPNSSKAAKEDKPAKKQANTVTKGPIKTEHLNPRARRVLRHQRTSQPRPQQPSQSNQRNLPLSKTTRMMVRMCLKPPLEASMEFVF